MTGEERLAILADHMETVDPEKLHMDYWQYGTAGCAAFHATQQPLLRADGLMMDDDGVMGRVPRYGEHFGFSAIIRFFEIDPDDSNFIFSPLSYFQRTEMDGPNGLRVYCCDLRHIAPSAVASHIREVLSRRRETT